MSVIEELVAQQARTQKRLDDLEARERPFALRGWRDDFLGDQLRDEYETQAIGAGSLIPTLQDAAHGGVVRLTAGPAVNRYSRLWLGAAAGGYNTLDADEGWTQIGRIKYSHTTNVIYWTGAIINPAQNRYILAGINTSINANYRIQCNDGVLSQTDSGVAADTDWHVHRLEAYPTLTGRRVDFFLDGDLIASHETNVPTEVLTPYIISYSLAAPTHYGDWDYWDVIPRNL